MHGSSVRRSHTTVVSRWLVMPSAATSAGASPASRSASADAGAWPPTTRRGRARPNRDGGRTGETRGRPSTPRRHPRPPPWRGHPWCRRRRRGRGPGQPLRRSVPRAGSRLRSREGSGGAIGILTGGGRLSGAQRRHSRRRAQGRRPPRQRRDRASAYGWRGVLDGNVVQLTPESTRGHPPPGRHDPRHVADHPVPGSTAASSWSARTSPTYRIDGLIVVGGEGTLSCAARLRRGGRRGRRRAEDDRQRHRRRRTSRSASTRPCRSPPTPSTACTPRPRATTG